MKLLVKQSYRVATRTRNRVWKWLIAEVLLSWSCRASKCQVGVHLQKEERIWADSKFWLLEIQVHCSAATQHATWLTATGVGKTSLIKAIVQVCEDIVHVDPLSAEPISIPATRRKSSRTKFRSGSADLQTTSKITEIYASTRSYPSWWSDLEESRILRRRKSVGDSVLERNLCFVDTPGYGNQTSVSKVRFLARPDAKLCSAWSV